MRPRSRLLVIATLAALLAACSSNKPPVRPTTPVPSTTTAPSPTPSPTKTGKYNYAGVKLPASDFQQYTWGYVGCSNTHDTLYGYHAAPNSAHLFWPFVPRYNIEGHVIKYWADPNNPIWKAFDHMKRKYNGGQDPPIIWVQLCENIGVPGRATFAESSYADVKAELDNLKAHAPTSIVFISPLQSYDPPTLCNLMGPNGMAVTLLTQMSNQAVDAGLAKPGPGGDDNPNLGPLTADLVDPADGCHPNGNPKHGPGMGSVFLGEQLADFFDHIPRS